MKQYSGIKAAPSKAREIIPAGGYVAKVTAGVVEHTEYGDRLVIYFDVCEGDYRGFFRKDYDAQIQEDKKWRGVYRMYLPKEDGSEKDGWNKRALGNVIWSFEASNKDYHWDWDEAGLKDKLIGVLFRNKEWDYNGKTGWTTECCALTDVTEIREDKYQTPKDKPLYKTGAFAGGGFTPLPDSDDDLPWK